MLFIRIIGEREIVTRLEDLFSDAMMTAGADIVVVREEGESGLDRQSHVRQLGQTFVFKY